jgi:hypothetical protein
MVAVVTVPRVAQAPDKKQKTMGWVGKDEGRRKRGKSEALASKEKNQSEQVGWVIWKSESVQPPGLISTCCGEPGPTPLLAPHHIMG